MTAKLTDRYVIELTLSDGRPQLVEWDSELVGFGVVVGRRSRTFVVQASLGGRKARRTIGALGEVREDRRHWTTTLARQRAKEMLGDMAAGIDPNAEEGGDAGAEASGPTLRDALEAHLARMRKKQRSRRSIGTLEAEVTKYLAAWLDRPIAELPGPRLAELHDQIKAAARPRTGSNPANAKGAPLANRVISHVSACWNSLNRKLEGALGTWNPAKVVDRDVLKPKRERVAHGDMPTWWAKVQALSPVRRDMQLFCMFSAMRSEAARHTRWDHVDIEGRSLAVPNPKGGEIKAFRLPLGPTLIELLARRRRENAAEFSPYGGDAGWVFPSLTRAKPYRVQPVAEARESRRNRETGRRENYLRGPHVSRRTYMSVAKEAGISELDRSVLANHAFGSQSVNQTYIEQHFGHLLDCQATIDAALLVRMGVQADFAAAAPAAPTLQLATHEATSALA